MERKGCSCFPLLLMFLMIAGVVALVVIYPPPPKPQMDAIAMPASAPLPQAPKNMGAKPPSSDTTPRQIVESEKRDLETARQACGGRVIPVEVYFFMKGFDDPAFLLGHYCPSKQQLVPPAEFAAGFKPTQSSVFGFVADHKLYLARFRSVTIRKIASRSRNSRKSWKRIPVWNLAAQPEPVTDWSPGQSEGQALKNAYHRSH